MLLKNHASKPFGLDAEGPWGLLAQLYVYPIPFEALAGAYCTFSRRFSYEPGPHSPGFLLSENWIDSGDHAPVAFGPIT